MDKAYKIKDENIKNILMWEGPDGCIASDRITVDGNKVGYMYREEPSNNADSGWRFFAGDESDEYVNDANNFNIYKLNTICNYDNDVIEHLTAPVGSAFIRDENGVFVEDTKQ